MRNPGRFGSFALSADRTGVFMPAAYVVRYGATRNIGEFNVRDGQSYERNAAVVLRTDRGVEWGEVLCPADERTRRYLGISEPAGRILRSATPDDHCQLDRVRQKEQEEFEGCREMIRERKLQMQLVDVEHLFGGERIIFYYLAEKR
ncbi:MAG TPA: hypothetical protein EYP14_08570, partial [Planctomycetaceae bacterium]|nr:hypothetical protein [Planctomycetaceae bacterium]